LYNQNSSDHFYTDNPNEALKDQPEFSDAITKARAMIQPQAAKERHEPCPGLGCDRRLFAWPGTIIQRRQWTERHGALDTASDRLIMHPQASTNGEKGRVVLLFQSAIAQSPSA
jgi:hypothetical protein